MRLTKSLLMTLLPNKIDVKNLLDKSWRMSTFWKIKNKSGQKVTFIRNRAQTHFNANKGLRNIILKARQQGFTTDETIDSLDDIAFNKNLDALIIAQDLDTAKDIFDNKVYYAWENFILKDKYRINTESARQLKLDFTEGSTSSITVDSSGRSGTFRRVHITEFAVVCKKFPDKAKEIIDGTIPAVPLDGRIDIESTALESAGYFHDMFWEAWDRGEPKTPTQFKAHFYNWTWDDSEIAKITENHIKEFLAAEDFNNFSAYQKTHGLSDREITYYYFKWLSLNRRWDSLRREYPTTPHEAFQGAGNKMFDEVNVAKILTEDPIEIEGQWSIYSMPTVGHKYVIGADIGEGIGRDHSTAAIIDLTLSKPRVVATYKNNQVAPDIFAFELKNGATKFQYAFIAPERNNHGHATISKLREIYPEDLIYQDDSKKFGWQTNLVSKPKMMYDLSTGINNEAIDIPSKAIVSEIRRFDKEDLRIKNYDDDATEHFDLLIATAIAFQMKDKLPVRSGKVVAYIPSFDD